MGPQVPHGSSIEDGAELTSLDGDDYVVYPDTDGDEEVVYRYHAVDDR